MGLILATVIGVALVWAGLSYHLQSRQQTIREQTHRDVKNLSIGVEKHVERLLTGVDQMMRFVAEDFKRDPETFDVDAWLRRSISLENVLTQVSMYNEAGEMLASRTPLAPGMPSFNVRDRAYFQALSAHAELGLYVDRTLKGRITGRYVLQTARRLNYNNGSFAGVIVTSIDPDYLSNQFKEVDVGAQGSIGLFGHDGYLRARYPQAEGMYERNVTSIGTGKGVFAHLKERPFGNYEVESAFDHVTRVFGYRTVGSLPLIVTVGKSLDEVMIPFQGERRRAILAGLGITALLFALLVLRLRDLGRDRRHGAALAEANRTLSDKEKIARAAEAHYRLLAENTTDVIIQSDLETRRLYVSPAARTVFGYNADELVGTRPLDFVHPDDADGYRRVLDDLTQGRVERAVSQQRYRRADGAYVWIEASFALTHDHESGRATGYVVSLRDISDRKAAEMTAAESETRYREVLEAAHHAILGQLAEGVIVTDASGRITLVNESAAAIHGVRRLDVEPDGYSDTYHLYTEDGHPYPPHDLALARAVRGETVTDTRWRILRPDGNQVLAIGTAQPLRDRDGGQVGAVLTLRDDTAREAAERSLRDLNATLGQRVAERTREVEEARAQAEAARAEAERASAAKTDFLAAMSHEIRTPLNGVLGYADLLLDEPAITPAVRQHGERIRDAGASLLTVVNDILDFSKIEAGQIDFDPRPFPLAALIDSCVSIVRGGGVCKGVALESWIDPALPPVLMGDADRLRQVLLNLVNNAVKFTSEGRVGVAVSKIGGAAGRVSLRIAVADTGIGIPQDKLPRLFERFSQVDSSISRRFGGTGLGLAICKRLVELMDGEIAVTSQEGQGSTFAITLTLPVGEMASESASSLPGQVDAGSAPARTGRSARILVAEDLDINQELVRVVLERAGHAIDVASDGAEALQAVQRADYDLVFMDVQMPVMDGLEATRRIRALSGPARNVPIVALTANVLPEQISRFRSAGMDDHVGKPFRREALLAAIARWLPREDVGTSPDAGGDTGIKTLDKAAFDSLAELLGPDKVAELFTGLEEHLRERLGPRLKPGTDPTSLAAQAHATVSAAGSLGFSDLANRCRKLEAACLSDDGIGDLIEQVDAAREAVLRVIIAVRDEGRPVRDVA